MRGEGALFARDAQRLERCLDGGGKRGEFRAGFDSGPEHARAALVWEKSQAAENSWEWRSGERCEASAGLISLAFSGAVSPMNFSVTWRPSMRAQRASWQAGRSFAVRTASELRTSSGMSSATKRRMISVAQTSVCGFSLCGGIRAPLAKPHRLKSVLHFATFLGTGNSGAPGPARFARLASGCGRARRDNGRRAPCCPRHRQSRRAPCPPVFRECLRWGRRRR